MKTPFDGIHLDPSQDTLESYRSTLDLLCDLSDQVGRFKSVYRGDEFILALEDRLVAIGVVLVTKTKTDASSAL